MLQLPADRREALEVLYRLPAPRLASRAKRRPDDLLQQRRFAVRRAAKYPEVSPGDAEARQLRGGAHDLEIRLVVDVAPIAPLRLDDPVVLKLANQAFRDPGLIQDLLERQRRHGRVH